MMTIQDKTHVIKRVVAEVFGITVEEMDSRQRPEYIAWPRQVAMFLVSKETPLPSARCGDIFGGREHATVLYAITRVNDRISTCQRDKSLVEKAHAKLKIELAKEDNAATIP